ncbi:MAG: hypothetical protein Q7S21_04310 [archaeon]|nr:hypothetical protein [archaeon]
MPKLKFLVLIALILFFNINAFAVVGRMWGDSSSPLSDSYFEYFSSGDNLVRKVIASSETQNSMYVGAVYSIQGASGTLYVNRVEKSTGQPVWSNDNYYFTFGGTNAQIEVMPFNTIPPANDFYVANPQRFFPSQTARRLEVQRVSSNGTSVWTLPTDYPPNSSIGLKKIRTDSAGNIFVPYLTSDLWVKKISPTGNVLFDLGEADDIGDGYDFIVHPNGSFFIIYETFSSGSDWLRGFDSSGIEIFSKSLYRYAEDEYPVGLSFSSDNGLFYLAQLNIPSPSYRLFKLDLAGNNFPSWPAGGILPTSRYVLPAPNGGAYSIFSDASENAIELTSYNSSGAPIFSDKKIMKYNSIRSDFFVDSFYNLYALLGGGQSSDVIVGKFNPDGTLFSRWVSDTGINASGANYDGIRALSANDTYFGYDFASDGYGGIFVASNGYVNATSSIVLAQRINELPPRIDSVTDDPDPSQVGQTVTFTVNWSDDDNPDDPVRMYICRGLSDEFCTGFSTICKDDVLNITNPKTCTYQTVAGDVGTNNYYAWLCGEYGNCDNASGTFTVGTLANDPPTVNILSPVNGQTFSLNPIVPITFLGEAIDAEDGTLTGNALQWTSDAVNIGSGTTFNKNSTDFSLGSHTIKLTATDSGNPAGPPLAANESITINIVDSIGNAPVISNIECSDDETNYAACSSFNSSTDSIKAVRAQCTDIDGDASNVEFSLIDPANSAVFDPLAATQNGSFWELNSPDQLLSIGQWEVRGKCVDATALSDIDSVFWNVLVSSSSGPITITDMSIEPFVLKLNESQIISVTTIVSNRSNNIIGNIDLELTTAFDCADGHPMTRPDSVANLLPRQSHTFLTIFDLSACGLGEGDYWINARASNATNQASFRALFTQKQADTVAVPETSMLLIPIILAVILIIINSEKKKTNS